MKVPEPETPAAQQGGMEEAIASPNGGRLRSRSAPLVILFGLFLAVKIAAFLWGYHRNLYVRSFEDLARLWYSCDWAGFQPFRFGPWLPLPQIVQSLAVWPRTMIFFKASLLQTLISVGGGVLASLIAFDAARKTAAAAFTLLAWVSSPLLTVFGLGFLSEPLFHLLLLLLLWSGLRWARDGGVRWRRIALLAGMLTLLTRYEGWVLVAFLGVAWAGLVFRCHRRPSEKWAGLTRTPLRDVVMIAIAWALVPLTWLTLSYFINSDFFAPIHSVHNMFVVNRGGSQSIYAKAAGDFVLRLYEFQPILLVTVLPLFAFPRLIRGVPLFLVVFFFVVFGLCEYLIHSGLFMLDDTARLASTCYVIFCPLFGILFSRLIGEIARRSASFRRLAYGGAAFFSAVVLIEGGAGFLLLRADSYDPFHLNDGRVLQSIYAHERSARDGYLYVDNRKRDYSTAVFAMIVPPARTFYSKAAPDGTIAADLSRRENVFAFLLTYTPDVQEWVIAHPYIHRVARGNIWDLYINGRVIPDWRRYLGKPEKPAGSASQGID